MGKTSKSIVFLVVYSLMVLAIFFFRLGGNYYIKIVDWLTYITPLISVFFGYTTFKYFGKESKQGKSILILTFATFLFFAAEVIWNLLGNPVVSIADLFWFSGFFLIYAAIIYSILMVYGDYFKNKKRVLIIAAISIIVSFFYFKLLPLSWNSEISPIENVVTTGYIFADLVLIILLVIMLSIVFSGSYSLFWIVFALAILIRVVSDVLYTLNYESYEVGSMIDLGWLFNYILFALSFIVLKHKAEALL
ncbi:MAG: hypothetical protein AABX00_06235 [Nanoarchaeota archaeon]